mgnify:CR=1 FL=1
MTEDELSSQIIGAAIEVHRRLGPGLLETAYEKCLAYELNEMGIECGSQVELPITYKGMQIKPAYRIDLLVEKKVIVEVKAVAEHHPIYDAQVLTYLKLRGCRLGLILNFNTTRLKDGIKRLVHNL